MEKIGNQKIWSYFDSATKVRPATNPKIRAGRGHPVDTYFDLAKKIAELQFLNRDHVHLFRGQRNDHLTAKGSSSLKPQLFRLNGSKIPTPAVISARFGTLRRAEKELITRYSRERFLGSNRLIRHRILRWAILQHYEVCATPLLDVTQSSRIAASFASLEATDEAFVFVFGVPNVSGAVTASSEANLQIVRLSSACPPEAVRPHLQEGYLLGEYPEIADYDQNAHYSYYELDFGRRLIAKFRFNPSSFWKSPNFPPVPKDALYPDRRDKLLSITKDIKNLISS